MRAIGKLLAGVAVAALAVSAAQAATVTGTVTGADGKPAMGVFVAARDTRTTRTIYVLTDAQGRYRIADLPAATYDVGIKGVGLEAAPRSGVALKADANASYDFAIKKRPVTWAELTTYQGRMLLPKNAEHNLSHSDKFFVTCFQSCHSFQNRMAPKDGLLDKDGWRSMVQYMSDTMFAGESRALTGKEKDDFASYLALMFGPDSPKPDSPEKMPEYAKLVRTFGAESMNIVYVEYDMPAPKGMGPWSAMEDRDGKFWIPYYGKGNEVIRLDADTGKMDHFALPFEQTAGIHSVIPSADGTVWFVENSLNKIAHLDPKTKDIKEYKIPKMADGRSPNAHTIRVDESGRVWTSGGPVITRFDPKSGEFKHWDVPGTYANTVGRNGDQWFTSFRIGGPIARVSKDDALAVFLPPTNGKPQRLDLDKGGNVWFSERQGNKVGVFDPKAITFKEFPLPGPEASPYALGIDRDGMVWYSSHEQDTVGRFDPKTEKTVEYPYPHPEASMREFYLDTKGRMWYASSANNTIGYFTTASAAK
ncbi:MAG TPA: carboxypeptidase regulatory-like domain-containing protein [Alphaproteobacteria bacterium]|jgi:streptogramin lyase|nr:carboxypeptidase regulatory-like domain-containing protein [Alphaproteobacteria bacterium]